tara:strand:- start:1645 stop:1857 length:213 start_codon:yes stop_codon:yes gene_type:complete
MVEQNGVAQQVGMVNQDDLNIAFNESLEGRLTFMSARIRALLRDIAERDEQIVSLTAEIESLKSKDKSKV